LERIIYLGVNLTEKYSTYILKIIKICWNKFIKT
jgi:hypothetical protein